MHPGEISLIFFESALASFFLRLGLRLAERVPKILKREHAWQYEAHAGSLKDRARPRDPDQIRRIARDPPGSDCVAIAKSGVSLAGMMHPTRRAARASSYQR